MYVYVQSVLFSRPRGAHDYYNMMYDPHIFRGRATTSTALPTPKNKLGENNVCYSSAYFYMWRNVDILDMHCTFDINLISGERKQTCGGEQQGQWDKCWTQG